MHGYGWDFEISGLGGLLSPLIVRGYGVWGDMMGSLARFLLCDDYL